MGIEIGCIVLAKKIADAGGDVAKALLLWNGGSDTEYPTRVSNRMPPYFQT